MGSGTSRGFSEALQSTSEADLRSAIEGMSTSERARVARAALGDPGGKAARQWLALAAMLDAVGIACASEKDFTSMSMEHRAQAILRTGAINLLSSNWLLRQPEDYIVVRNQDLPADAFLEGSHAAQLLDLTGGIVVSSYGWLTKRHPDPLGWHLRTLRKYLRKHVDWDFKKNCVKVEEDKGLHDVGLFWDFTAFPQVGPDGTPKSQEEQMRCSIGLKVINLLYGAKRTIVVQLKAMPESFVDPGGGDANLIPYEKRGWCIFEEVGSAIIKDADRLLDISHCGAQLADPAANFRDVRYHAVQNRQPPHAPSAMREVLSRSTFTNGEVDQKLVIDLYIDFFIEAAGTLKGRLFLPNRGSRGGWGDNEICMLAEALPAYSACEVVDLDGHTQVTESGLSVLHPALLNLPLLEKVILPLHLKDSDAGVAFKKAWTAAGKAEENLRWLTKGRDS